MIQSQAGVHCIHCFAPSTSAASPTSPLLATHPPPHPSPASPFHPHHAHTLSPRWRRGACLCAESQLSRDRPSRDDFVRRHLPSCKQLMSFHWRKEGRQSTRPMPPTLPVEKPRCPVPCVARAGSLSFPPLEARSRLLWGQWQALCNPGSRAWCGFAQRSMPWCSPGVSLSRVGRRKDADHLSGSTGACGETRQVRNNDGHLVAS